MTYYNVVEVEAATVNLKAKYRSLVRLITLPNATFEGRTSHAVCLGNAARANKDAVMIVGGLHAREWGSCEIALNLAVDLLDAYEQNTGLIYGRKTFNPAEIQTLLDTLDIVVFPLVNPDGRNYSQPPPADPERLWRKNRNPANSRGNPDAVGIDINRNFDFLFDIANAFDAAAPVSASMDPADPEVYQGPKAFSEAESLNVQWLVDQFPRTRWFVDLHSPGQTIQYVWGDDDAGTDPAMTFLKPAFDLKRGLPGDAVYQEFLPAADLTAMQGLAQVFVADLQTVGGTTYKAKPAYAFTPYAGTSHDYVYSRQFVDSSKGKILGFFVEWGLEWQPLWIDMQPIIKEVTAGLIGFCTAASNSPRP